MLEKILGKRKMKYEEVECREGIEPLLYIRMPDEFQHFEYEDLVSFHDLYIKMEEGAFLCRRNGTVYMCIFELPLQKRVNKGKFIKKSKELYRLCLRRYWEKNS